MYKCLINYLLTYLLTDSLRQLKCAGNLATRCRPPNRV